MPQTYKIGEAASLLNLKTYILRFWETEFPQIVPLRTEKGQRLYTEEHLALLSRIRFLLHERGLTIEGARKILAEEAVRGVRYVRGHLTLDAPEEEPPHGTWEDSPDQEDNWEGEFLPATADVHLPGNVAGLGDAYVKNEFSPLTSGSGQPVFEPAAQPGQSRLDAVEPGPEQVRELLLLQPPALPERRPALFQGQLPISGRTGTPPSGRKHPENHPLNRKFIQDILEELESIAILLDGETPGINT